MSWEKKLLYFWILSKLPPPQTTKQLVITDDNEELFFKLPGPKKRLQKIKHNLMDLVKNGRGPDKKQKYMSKIEEEKNKNWLY